MKKSFTRKSALACSLMAAFTLLAAPVSAVAKDNHKHEHKHEHSKYQDVLTAYADIALANYTDSLNDAQKLQKAIDAFVAKPNQTNLDNAKAAWLQTRESYGETEIFRLSNGPIDAEEGWVLDAYGNLEAQINAWPLDEHMIDYTLDADGKRTSGNIIDTKGKFNPGGENPTAVDVTKITVKAITDLNENGGEANVSSGWHAIEFLLWGQDQDYNNFLEDKVTHGKMTAGQRPLSDFTTDKYAKRRLAYLQAATEKLVDDIATVQSAWVKKVNGNDGLYRAALLEHAGDKNIDRNTALRQIFGGMGMFIKSELANERIAVAVLTPSEEDEHSCFSDNTHRDIHANFAGFKNALFAEYKGKKYGAAPFDALNAKDKAEVQKLIENIDKRIAKVDEIARTNMHFDYQIMPQNKSEVQNIVSLKNDLRRLGDKMVLVAKAHGVSMSEADVTDSEENRDYEK